MYNNNMYMSMCHLIERDREISASHSPYGFTYEHSHKGKDKDQAPYSNGTTANVSHRAFSHK